jgi:phage shock protein E
MKYNLLWIAVGVIVFLFLKKVMTHPEHLDQNIEDVILIDVRTPSEYKSHTLPNAHNFPVQTLGQSLDRLEKTIDGKDTKIAVFCVSGGRSRQAASLLKENGFSNVIDIGSINNYAKE